MSAPDGIPADVREAIVKAINSTCTETLFASWERRMLGRLCAALAPFFSARDEEIADLKRQLAEEQDRLGEAYGQFSAARNEIARLNGQTKWQCSCGGTDCEGQREIEELRTQLDRLRTALEERTDAYNMACEDCDSLHAKLQHANEAALRAINAKVSLIADNARLISENKQLHEMLQGKDEK